MRQTKHLYAAALMASLSAAGEPGHSDYPGHRPKAHPPRKFTDARIAEAEKKRQRKRAKRLAQQGRKA